MLVDSVSMAQKYLEKTPEGSRKQNWNLPHADDDLHGIYIAFTTIHTVVSLYWHALVLLHLALLCFVDNVNFTY